MEEKKEDKVLETEIKEETTKVPTKDKKGFAITSMILGIIALVLFCQWYISVPCAVLAIIFGIISVKSSKRGMAIAGIVTGVIGAILTIAIIIMVTSLGVAIFNNASKITDEIDKENDYYENKLDKEIKQLEKEQNELLKKYSYE